MRDSNAAVGEKVLLASISANDGQTKNSVLEAALKDSNSDNAIVTSNLDDGSVNVVITAKQADYLTENVPADKGQRYIGIFKTADDNGKDRTQVIARIVEFK